MMGAHLNKRSITGFTLSDGTSGTQLTYAAKYWGTVGWTNGGHNLSHLRDEAGDFVTDAGPVKGDEQLSKITLSDLQLRNRGNDSTIDIMDILNQTGVWASTWVSTTDQAGNCNNAEKTMNLAVPLIDCSGSTQTYYWERVTVDPASVVFNEEGALSSVSFTSAQPYPSTTAPTVA